MIPESAMKRVCVGADAGVVVERRQRETIERHGARVCALRECLSNFTSTGAPHTLQKPRCVSGVDS
jgi:hypothetical protein